MQEFIGVLLTLKKWEENISRDDPELYKYIVLGHYDGLDIHTVDKWYDFRPKGLLERKLQVDLGVPFIDQYTIRALMPGNRDELDKLGFAYRFWENAGRTDSKEYEEYEKELKSKYPFVSMSVINLTEQFVRTKSNLQEIQGSLIDIIQESARQAKYDLSELHCALLPSIGYSDFIILFHTDDLTKAANVVSQMRGAVTSEGITVVSNCYSVCGLDRTYFDNGSYNLGQNTRISIRINLKEGISANAFKDLLSGKAGDDFADEIRECFYITFGSSDCLLLPEQPLDRYLKWHGPNQILNPGNEFFRNYISNVRTTIRIGGEEFERIAKKSSSNKKDLSIYESKFDEFNKKYDDFLKKHNKHIRSSRSMRQIMKNFFTIAQTSHGFDAEHIMGTAFDALIQNVEYYISKQPVEIETGMTDDEKKSINDYNEQIMAEKSRAVEALEKFKEYIGSFISDFIRSDRPFIEGNALMHSSIGSATKLLFAYSAILENMVIRDNIRDGFVFIVLSGGCDRTEAIDLFSFEHNNSNVKKTIIIKIPEMSLYDIQGTLFRILHEYMHFIKNRRRKERYYHLIKALSSYIAWDMVRLEFSEERFRVQCEQATFHLTGELAENVRSQIRVKYNKIKDEVQAKISDEICRLKLYTEYGKTDEEEKYYASTLREEVLHIEKIASVFSTTEENFGEEPEDNLQKKLYRILYESDKELTAFILGILENLRSKEGDSYNGKLLCMPVQSFRFLQQKYVYEDEHPSVYDVKIKSFIEQYMGSLILNFPLTNGGIEKFEATYSYPNLVNMILFPMVESFCDCCAIRTVNMKTEDFLLSFIYELWDIEAAFQTSVENILRMGADLKVIYGIEWKIPDYVKQDIDAKVQKREKQGYTYQNVDEMIEYVDEILIKYQRPEFAGIRKEVECYLQKCVGEKNNLYYQELANIYELCNFDTPENIYGAVDEIICQWKNFGKGDD